MVRRHALAGGVRRPEEELGSGVPLIGDLAEPFHGLRMVSRHALAAFVHHTEIGLGTGPALLRSFAIPITPSWPPKRTNSRRLVRSASCQELTSQRVPEPD